MTLNKTILLLVILFAIQKSEIESSPLLLELKEQELNDIISNAIDHENQFYDPKNSIVILNVQKKMDIHELRICLLSKKEISSYLLDEKKIKLSGYYEFNGIPVLVYGKYFKDLFEKTKRRKYFSFLDNQELKEKIKRLDEDNFKKGIPPPAPAPFEPVISIYHYKDSKFKFHTRGMFALLW